MYLHIGGDVIVYVPEIVAILNLSTIDGKQKMETLIQNHSVIHVTPMSPKSLVIQQTSQKELFYYSPISTITLNKRLATPHPFP